MSAYDSQYIAEYRMDGYEDDDCEECEECQRQEATHEYEGMALCYGCYRWLVYGTS
jgi:formylmethanofuran dehydrogenase subunit E